MLFEFSDREFEIRRRAAGLVEALIPFEQALDDANGDAPDELERSIRQVCLDSGLFAPNFPVKLEPVMDFARGW